MKNSKAVQLFRTFDGFEWRSFGLYLEGNSPHLMPAFEYMRKAADAGFGGDSLERRKMFKALYPGEPFKYQQLSTLLSQLLKNAEDWLTSRHLQSEAGLWESAKAEAMLRRQLPKHYRQCARRARKETIKTAESPSLYYQKYRLEHLAELDFVNKNERRADPSLQEASDALDYYFALQKLQYICIMIERQRLIPVQYQYHFLEPVLKLLGDKELEEMPLLQLYYHLYCMLAENQYARFRDLYYAKLQMVSLEERKRLLYFAINYCIGRIRQGKREFAQELLGFYQFGISQKILFEEKQISPWTYKNIVKLGLNLGRFDWVERFVRDYSEFLSAEEKEDALHYNLAELYFFRGRYEAALQHLVKVEFTDIHYNMGAKALLAKIYYESGETEALVSLLNAFRVFLRRNRSVAPEVKEPYANFINLLSKAVRQLPDTYPKLRKEAEANPLINNRDWLIKILQQ